MPLTPEICERVLFQWPTGKRQYLKVVGNYYKENEEPVTTHKIFKYYEKSLPSHGTVYKYVGELREEGILVEKLAKIKRKTVVGVGLSDYGQEIYDWLSDIKEISKTMSSREYEKIFAKDDDEFYKDGCEIIQNSKIIRCAAKTPILLLSSERRTDWRRRYYEILMDGIVNKGLQVKYLFSREATIKKLGEYWGDIPATGALLYKTISRLIKNRNLDLRYVDSDNFMSCLVGENKALYLLKDPQTWETKGVVKEHGEKVKIYQEYFDTIFLNAIKIQSPWTWFSGDEEVPKTIDQKEASEKLFILFSLEEFDKGEGVKYSTLLDISKYDEKKLDDVLSELIGDGEIYEVKAGRFRRV